MVKYCAVNVVDIGSNPINHPKLKMVSCQSGLMRGHLPINRYIVSNLYLPPDL